jgi:hypothetical protein
LTAISWLVSACLHARRRPDTLCRPQKGPAVNDHQRKMARKSRQPAGYRDGGMIRQGYEHGGTIEPPTERVVNREKAEPPPSKAPKSLRDIINPALPKAPKKSDPPPEQRPSFVRG